MGSYWSTWLALGSATAGLAVASVALARLRAKEGGAETLVLVAVILFALAVLLLAGDVVRKLGS